VFIECNEYFRNSDYFIAHLCYLWQNRKPQEALTTSPNAIFKIKGLILLNYGDILRFLADVVVN